MIGNKDNPKRSTPKIKNEIGKLQSLMWIYGNRKSEKTLADQGKRNTQRYSNISLFYKHRFGTSCV